MRRYGWRIGIVAILISISLTNACRVWEAESPMVLPVLPSPVTKQDLSVMLPDRSPEISQTMSANPEPSPDLAIDRDRLMAAVEQLSQFDRYSDAGRKRTRDWLKRQLQSFGWQVVEQTFDAGQGGIGVNLIATRTDREPERSRLIVDAHYDAVPSSPGADDNASGVAALLELARLLAHVPTQNNLELVLFDREEFGLAGSSAFVQVLENVKDLKAVINLEMIGYACHKPGCQAYPTGLPIDPPSDRGNFLVVVGEPQHLELLQAFEQIQTELLIFTLPVPLKGLVLPDVLRSDHAPFWFANIPAVMVTDTANLRNPNYHQPTDTPDTLDLPFFGQVAQIVLDVSLNLLTS